MANLASDALIPDLLRAHPHLRAVFDRYGLKGCGGKYGPSETLEFFAKTHGVALDKLTDELSTALRNPDKSPATEYRPSIGDLIYRPFFAAGVIMAVVPGAIYGSWMLYGVAADGFGALSINRMNAHAHAMIYGFIGMFIMGFGYQALPRFKHTVLWGPRLAVLSFGLMALGLILRIGGEYLSLSPGEFELHVGFFSAGLVGTILELVAVLLFAVITLRTYRESGKPTEIYDRYILAAVAWMAVGLVGSLLHFIGTSTAISQTAQITQVAIFQEPLRNAQILGMTVMIIFGVMLRLLPPVFGFRSPGDRLYRRLFWPLNVGILAMSISFMLMMLARRGMIEVHYRTFGGAYTLASLVVIVSFLWLSVAFRPWRATSSRDRSVKFVRAAHGWLAVGLLMLLVEPYYISFVYKGFAHGFHAGMRHAVTVGFICMMIVAIASKIGPTLGGFDTSKLRPLWGVFILLNLGVAWRVVNEVIFDHEPGVAAGLPVSGALILAALGLWGAHMLSVLRPRRVDDGMTAANVSIKPGARAVLVIERWPQTLEVFLRHGFAPLKNPVVRRTVARNITLEAACALQQVDIDVLMRELREAAVGAEDRPADGPETTAGKTTTEGVRGAQPWSLDPNASVAETARNHPLTVPVFARLGLDACCGGAESIAVSAKHNNHELSEVMNQLEAALAGEQP